jgi:histidyl-tRNA synthetase
MLRPWWFPEYWPQEQKIFDIIQACIRMSFEQRNFQHIWTPAVEKNEILLKWGETVANEIFWLISAKPVKEFIKKMIEIHKNMSDSLVMERDQQDNILNERMWITENKEAFKEILINKVITDELHDNRLVLNNELVSLLDSFRKEWIKDYSLHFDLTVPFARYTLDHFSELTFPFKRYQMQPVRRGERQQRWRFKEFRQCDVDCIWPSGTKVGYRYACETIATLQWAMSAVFEKFSVQKRFVSHISHIALTKAFLAHETKNDVEKIKRIVELLDKFYKKNPDDFYHELSEIAWSVLAERINILILSKDYSVLQEYDQQAYEQLDNTLKTLNALGSSITYDFTIVRWLGYYTDIVFETFLENEMSLWSICSGGGYQDFTKFIDPKQVFSGIWWSIWLSRLMEIMMEVSKDIHNESAYLFLNFEETFPEILSLYTKYIADWKTVELYPTPAKFGKQLEYADKKGIRYAIILWSDELEKGIYKVKDLVTGEEKVDEIERK